MSNPTTPFNWQMPQNTDLVTDLPADFEVFGQAVATSMADLLGGTSGQILSKATNADMDFTWINNDQGDITGITATSPLTGGGTSGAITVGIQAASTTQSGAVQLSDSTSTTSSVLAATPTAVKAAKDAADTAQTTATAAIPKSTVTTAGDVIYATGSGAVTRLGIGTAGQVLKVNSGATAPEWGAGGGTSGLTLITRQTFSAAGTVNVNDVFSSTYDNYKIIIKNSAGSIPGLSIRLRVSGADNTTSNYNSTIIETVSGTSTVFPRFQTNASSFLNGDIACRNTAFHTWDVAAPNLSQETSFGGFWSTEDTGWRSGVISGMFNATTSFTGFSFYGASGTITGVVTVYGYQKS